MEKLELVEGLEIVGELPVAYARKYKTIILADTHIGFEEEITSKGGYIPRFQLKNTLRTLEEAFSVVSAEKVVFAGDLKHLFGTLGRMERQELIELLGYIKKHVAEVIVVRGNHDNFLPIMKRWIEFEIVESYMSPPYLIVHGHKPLGDELKSSDWQYLIMGHEHPSIALRDPIGVVGKFSCFLVGDTLLSGGRKVVVLPAVGIYQTGSRVTLSKDTYLSPVIKEDVIIESLRPIVVGPDIGVVEFPRLGDLFDLML